MLEVADSEPLARTDKSGVSHTAKLIAPIVFLAQLSFFIYVGLHRLVNGDEGFYLAAAKLIGEHKKLYRDFFFLQMPLTPYVYGAWMKLTHVSWVTARILAALVTTLLGMLIYTHVCRLTRGTVAGICAALLFAGTTLVFGFFLLAAPHSLACVLMFSAYLVVSRVPSVSNRWLAVGGLLFGLSVDTRSYLVMIGPLFVWWIWHCSERGVWLRSAAWFAMGFVVAMLLPLYLFVLSPGGFMFGNLGYHSLRSGSGLVGLWQQKLFTVLQALIGGPPGNGIQASLLLLICVAFISSIQRERYVPRFAFVLSTAIGVISLLPTPVYPQYFAYCFPFLIVAAVGLIHDLLSELESRSSRLLGAAGCVALLAIYLVAPVNDFHRYMVTGEGIPGLERVKDKEDWRVQRILEVSRAIDGLTRPGEAVISLWPGYLFQTHTVPLPSMESDFSLPVAAKVSPEHRRRYHLLTTEELDEQIASHRTRVVVLGNENRLMQEDAKDSVANTLQSNGYKLVRSIGDTEIYVCCGGQ